MIILHGHYPAISVVNVIIISLGEALPFIWVSQPILGGRFHTDPAASRVIITGAAVIAFLDQAFLDDRSGSLRLAPIDVSLALFAMVDGDLLLGRLVRHVKHLRHYLVCLLVTLLGVSCLSLDSLLEAGHPLV